MKVLLQHVSSIRGARWCRPIGWDPKNKVEGAEFVGDSWWSEGEGKAGLVCFSEGAEGTEIEVAVDDLKVASCGECKVISEVQV